jgi:hypothetical protein
MKVDGVIDFIVLKNPYPFLKKRGKYHIIE